MFFRGSRYENVPASQLTAPDGTLIRYVRMRFIPLVQSLPGYTVQQGDRPDLAAYKLLGDAEQFWQLCDANTVQRPAELTAVPGTRLAVPGPRMS
jgi:hypothetical protein